MALSRKDDEITSLNLLFERLTEHAVAQYRSTDIFKEEVAKAMVASYDIIFSDRLKQVKKLYLNLDVSNIEPLEGDNDENDLTQEPTQADDDLPLTMEELTPAVDNLPLTMEESTPVADNPLLMVEECIEIY